MDQVPESSSLIVMIISGISAAISAMSASIAGWLVSDVRSLRRTINSGNKSMENRLDDKAEGVEMALLEDRLRTMEIQGVTRKDFDITITKLYDRLDVQRIQMDQRFDDLRKDLHNELREGFASLSSQLQTRRRSS